MWKEYDGFENSLFLLIRYNNVNTFAKYCKMLVKIHNDCNSVMAHKASLSVNKQWAARNEATTVGTIVLLYSEFGADHIPTFRA